MTEQQPTSEQTRASPDASVPADDRSPASPPLEAERDRLDWLENRQPRRWSQRVDRFLFVALLIVATAACIGMVAILLRYFTR